MYNYQDSIHNKQLSLYKRKRKKMFCPACQDGQMSFYKNAHFWQCEQCGYRIFQKELDNNYLFWFCDECGAFLNNQVGFNQDSYYHICTTCNHKNYLDANNIKNICRTCGTVIPDDQTLCEECKQKRKQKRKDNLMVAGQVAAAIAVVAAAAYLDYLSSQHESDDDEDYSLDDTDYSEESLDDSSAPEEKTLLYSTNEYSGGGKQNYYHNEYYREGDRVVKYKCHRYKFFDGKENTWETDERVDDSWELDDDTMPDWLHKYL